MIFATKVFSSFVTVGSGPFLTYSGKLISTRKSNSAVSPHCRQTQRSQRDKYHLIICLRAGSLARNFSKEGTDGLRSYGI